jgi:hypothetical protein
VGLSVLGGATAIVESCGGSIVKGFGSGSFACVWRGIEKKGGVQ